MALRERHVARSLVCIVALVVLPPATAVASVVVVAGDRSGCYADPPVTFSLIGAVVSLAAVNYVLAGAVLLRGGASCGFARRVALVAGALGFSLLASAALLSAAGFGDFACDQVLAAIGS